MTEQKNPFDFPDDKRDPNEMDFGKAERKEIEKRNRRRLQRDAEDMKKVLALVEGRRVLAKILYKTCVFADMGDIIESSFNPNAMSMAFTEGCRKVGFGLLNEIKHANASALLQIQRERESDFMTDAREKSEVG